MGNATKRLRWKREKMWRRDPRCSYCQRILTLAEATVDHVKPQFRGGSHRWSNLRLSCGPCNVSRTAFENPGRRIAGRGRGEPVAPPQPVPDEREDGA